MSKFKKEIVVIKTPLLAGLVLSLFIFNSNFSIVKGSETVVSVEAVYEFPAIDSDNTMLGFGWFKNGFSLEDATTTCTFDSVYPVSGTVDLKGGTLSLGQDLFFNNTTTIQGWGAVFGNNHLIDFCSSVTYLPSNATCFYDTKIVLNADLVISTTLTFKGVCSIDSQSNILCIGHSGALVIDDNSTLELRVI